MTALYIGKRSLPKYAHRFAPKTYTQPQLFACLVLKKFFKTDYRGVVAQLQDSPMLCKDIGLKSVPHFTTLQKASVRLLSVAAIRAMIGRSLTVLKSKRTIRYAAVDSTGFERTNRSPHCAAAMRRHRKKTPEDKPQTSKRRFIKLGILIDCATHLIHAIHLTAGPRPDVDELKPILKQCRHRKQINTLLADAGYDSELNHEFLRDVLNIRSVIPAKASRPSSRLPAGYYRRCMRQRFAKKTYRRRAQVETVMSMIKRNLQNHTWACGDTTRKQEAALMAITHNIMIVRQTEELFYAACRIPFAEPPEDKT